jgi:hypothetical protein
MPGPAPSGCRIHEADYLLTVRRDRTGRLRTRCKLCAADAQQARRDQLAEARGWWGRGRRPLKHRTIERMAWVQPDIYVRMESSLPRAESR